MGLRTHHAPDKTLFELFWSKWDIEESRPGGWGVSGGSQSQASKKHSRESWQKEATHLL